MLGPRIIVALDFPDTAMAMEFVSKLDPSQCRLKIGKALFVSGGPQFVAFVQNKGFDVFLDLKFHDIPNTVAAACHVAADLGVWMVNIHALGGLRMMQAAKDAIASHSHEPLLVAVTILTSVDKNDLQSVGLVGEPADNVDRLAALAETAGVDGVVCSAQEASRLRQTCKDGFVLVTPGIRPDNSDINDQKRIMTPSGAIQEGASYLVIGRPIIQAVDPPAILEQIHCDLAV